MALDREKTFLNVERLLKQGKTAQALDECRRLAEDAPKDLLMLNRLGDLLARSQRGADAIVYYGMIVADFSGSGFYPKAIAILKKIVKLDPNHLPAVVQLGDLNVKQKLPGEARAWFLQAAEAYLRGGEFEKAREVFEKLVAAEPESFVHVARLSEATAAAGDPARGALGLVALGNRMLAAGKIEDAERAFKRASEILPGRAEAMLGLARCQAANGQRDEALALADQAWSSAGGTAAIAGEIVLLFEQAGDSARSERFFLDSRSDAVADESMELAFRAALTAGSIDGLWSRFQPMLDRWVRSRQFERSARLLERIARIEDGGYLRALEQFVEVRKAEGNKAATARAIERLVRAYQAKGPADKVAPQLEALKTFDPTSPLLFLGRAAGEASAAGEGKRPPAAGTSGLTAYEAPAVPIVPADHEFVSGNLTEAEVFEKYGLHREALQQLQQITARFPGHVMAQEKMVGFLRAQPDRGALRDGLVGLALARRASGDTEGARRAAREGAAIGGLEPRLHEVLERFALIAREEAAPPPAPTPAAAPAAPPKSSPPPAAPPKLSTAITRAEEEELEILFDDSEVGGDAAPSALPPGQEALEEIEFYLGQGMTADALSRIVEARKAGVQGAPLDALEARARAVPAPEAGAASAGEAASDVDLAFDDEPSGGGDRLDEDDLSSITAALEAEYGIPGALVPGGPPAAPATEQSVDEVFDTFKEHVKASVEAGDFRTHYDLGIAYKEMGLLDDALAEFRIASATPELYRESCSMLGLCHWERGDADEAIRWYRAAIEAPGSDEVPLAGLRYELADLLEASGDARGAYDLLSLVVAEQPGYRDVDTRIATLRGRLGL